jgi:hypothetical protein
VPTDCSMELCPRNLVVVLKSGGVSGPPSSCRTAKLLGGIQSSGTLCSEVAQILTQWCGASYLPPTNRSAQRRVLGESPGSQSMKSKYPGDRDVVSGLLHDVHHSLPTSSLPHSMWPVVARCSLADVVVGLRYWPTWWSAWCLPTVV